MSKTAIRKICLRNYDAYGFDLDWTLAKYNLVNQIKLSYNGMVDFLIKEKGYDESLRLNIDDQRDFLCKGLIVDVEHGNIIKLSHNGKVLRGSHGFRMLSRNELVSCYGDNLHWKHYNKEEDVFKLGNQIYAFKENYFNIPELVLVSRIVELLDKKNGGPLADYTKTGMIEDIGEALEYNYVYTSFTENKGLFFQGLKSHPETLYQACSEGLKTWLRDLKKQAHKCVFLITSSHIDFADHTATNVLGTDWKSYFDIIITNARKPGFFVKEEPFLSLDGIKEDKPVNVEDLQQHGVYSSGNYKQCQQFITKFTGISKPKVIYFGDSIRSDAIPTQTMTDWDVGLVLEEMEAEGYQLQSNCKGEQGEKPMFVRNVNVEMDVKDKDYLLSKVWGSFFYQPDEDPRHNRHMNTFWGEMITKYSDIAIPSMEYIAGLPLDTELPCFNHNDDGNTDGFSPGRPVSLQELDN